MDAFIGFIFIVAIIYGACKLLSSDNQQSDNNTDQTDSSKSQDYYASKSTSDNPPGLSKEEIDRIGNEAKANQHYRVESTKTTGSSPQQPFDTTPDTKDTTKPSPRVISTPTAYYEIKKTSQNAKLKQDSFLSSGNTSVTTKSKTTSTYQTEYEKRKQEIDEGIKNGTYRVTQVPGNARTNKPSAKSKKSSYLKPSTQSSSPTYQKPSVQQRKPQINPDNLDSYPPHEQIKMLTDYYKTHYFQSNRIGTIMQGITICPNDGHVLFRTDTFYKSQLYKQVLCCQKCHTIYPYEKVKYVDFTEGKHILYVCQKHTVGTKNNHNTVSVTGFLGVRGGNKIQINLSYCYNCKRFFIYYEAYEEYRRKYGWDIMGDIVFLTNSLDTTDTPVNPESVLHKYGYTVNVNSKLTSSDRQRILKWIIDNNILPKTDVIGYLSIFIDRGKNIPSWHDAVLKWQSDLAYIQEYKCSSQQTAEIGPIVKWRH